MKFKYFVFIAGLISLSSSFMQADVMDDIAAYVSEKNWTKPEDWNQAAIANIVRHQIQADDEALGMIKDFLIGGVYLGGWLLGVGLTSGGRSGGIPPTLLLYSWFGPEGDTKETVNDIIKVLIIIDLVILAIRLFPAAVVLGGTVLSTPFAALLALKIGAEKLYHKALLKAFSTPATKDDKASLLKAFREIAALNETIKGEIISVTNKAKRFGWKNYIRGILLIRDIPADEEGAVDIATVQAETKTQAASQVGAPVPVGQISLWSTVPTQQPTVQQPVGVQQWGQQPQPVTQSPPGGISFGQQVPQYPPYQQYPQYSQQSRGLLDAPSPYRVVGYAGQQPSSAQ